LSWIKIRQDFLYFQISFILLEDLDLNFNFFCFEKLV
jgi:hypothetical protein